MDFGLALFGRMLATLIAVFWAYVGYTQEYARPLTLESDSLITVYTFDNDTTIRWIKGTKNKPKGTITDSSYYLLLNETYLPTTAEKSGDMLYDGEIIPLDGIVFGSTKVSNFANRRRFDELPKLRLSLEWHRTVYRYNSTQIVYGNDTIHENQPMFEKFKDGLNRIIKTEDRAFLRVESDKSLGDNHHFAILIKDCPEPIKRKDFVVGAEIELDEDLIKKIGIELNDKQTSVKPIERIAVVSRGCSYSFIKEVQFTESENRDTLLQVPKKETGFSWWWIVIGAAVLLALAGRLVWLFLIKNKLKTVKTKKKFVFRLGSILKESVYGEVVQKMKDYSEPSMHFKEDPNDMVISFEVNAENVQWLVKSTEKQQGFYYELGKCIEEAKPDGLPERKKNTFNDEIEVAKKQLADIDDFIDQLLNDKGKSNNPELDPKTIEEYKKELEKYKNAFDRLEKKFGFSDKSKFDDSVKLLDDAVENWVDLKKRLTPTPNDSSDVVNRINLKDGEIDILGKNIVRLTKEKEGLKNELDNWERQTGYKEPEKAKKDIDDLKEIKRDPKTFKGRKEYDKLSKLIEDAEDGTKVRDKMNNDPNEIEKGSPTGILVRKGRILDKYIVISNDVFKKNDAESKIDEIINTSRIAIQVKKGNFLDNAKKDVALIREDEENLLGNCELKTFIEYVVNPHEILSSTTRTKTGLYKLMHDVDAVIAPNGKEHKPIKIADIQYNWLKDRVVNVVEDYDNYLDVVRVASKYGTPDFDSRGLKNEDVRRVFEKALSYLEFGEYKNYWKNIVSPLFNTLDSLPTHDEIHNTRALMFYTSQFYSIACIMNEIYGDQSYYETSTHLNVGLFNTNATPVPTHLGFPQLDNATLQKCKFDYKSDPNDNAKVKYLQRYKPLPFILIFSYFDDNTLS